MYYLCIKEDMNITVVLYSRDSISDDSQNLNMDFSDLNVKSDSHIYNDM